MNNISNLLRFLENSTSVFHAIQTAEEFLQKNHFENLDHVTKLENGKKYFTSFRQSALIAFQLGSENDAFRIIGSHADSPTFQIKPHALIESHNVYKLNTEVYGGPILSTWFDRDLSIAGRVFLKGDSAFLPKMQLIDFKRPILCIPNVAIHLNHDVNKGVAINPQKHTLPVISLKSKHSMEQIIAEELSVSEDKILDYDLFLYDTQKPEILGLNKGFIASGKLDNLMMVFASLQAIATSNAKDISVCYIANHEEIGSATSYGADGVFLEKTMKKIATMLHKDIDQMISHSFLISADQTHAYHPNYGEKNDITTFPIINQGPAIKKSSKGFYATDGYSSSIIRSIAGDLPLQEYVNRSDIRAGSTIGPILSKKFSIPTVDLGCPIWAMHSVREYGGIKDLETTIQLFQKYYSL